MKHKGVLLSAQAIFVVMIIIIIMTAGAGAGYYTINNWRTCIADTQAEIIDKKLTNYVAAHRTVPTKSVGTSTTNLNINFHAGRDYPLFISEVGVIEDNSGQKGLLGYFNQSINFIKYGENPQLSNNLYKFHYIPLDENGNEIITLAGKERVAFYTIEYYTKNGFGEVIRHVSPRSYDNLSDKEKSIR